MANLSSAESANPQVGPFNASILSEVHTLENAIDHSVANQDEHEIRNKVQQSDAIDSTSVYMGNCNVIPYEQYLSINNISVVPSCASSTLNNVCVSFDNDAFVPHDPIANELKIYKEQVAIYEQDRPKKAQPALYDGEELLKTHHVPVNVPSFEEELELAEATSNKLNVKMNDSVCVEKRVNITPPNYSKENFMATFTPQTQLTPEQVFWSLDLAKRKDEELKANATPLSVLPPATVFSTAYAFTSAQKRIADLESENFNLRNKIQNDDHDSMIKHFSKLEVEHFNLQLKYQNLKERFGNKKPVTSSDAPSFDSLFVIGKLNEQIQSRGNTIRELKEKISRLTKKNSDADPIFDLKALVSQNKDLTAKLNALHDLNECFRAENAKVKQHYKELYDSIKITRAKTTDQNNSL
ncbi:hypothetical protein Tco_0347987 [Tanacetum coccineum]